MASERSRPSRPPVRRSESAASALILLALALVALGVYLQGRRGPAPPPPAEPGEVGAKPPRNRIIVSVLRNGDVLTSNISNAMPGYVRGKGRMYDAETLYEYIDGEAPRYVQFGFRALETAEYEKPGAPPLVTDLYFMTSKENAYGIYMDSFAPEAPPADVGRGGYRSGNLVAFWTGPWYVRVSSPVEADAGALVLEAAKALAGTLKDSGPIPEIEYFPRENLLPGSIVYLASDAFGHAHLLRVFAAEYEAAGAKRRLFFLRADSPDAARATLRKHAEALRAAGAVVLSGAKGGDLAFWGRDPYAGPTLLRTKGAVLAGVLGLADRAEAEAEAARLLERIEAGASREATP